jgi:hypothetical protein
MMLEAIDKNNQIIGSDIIYSIGGGDIVYDKDIINKENENLDALEIYSMTELTEIQNWANETGKSY